MTHLFCVRVWDSETNAWRETIVTPLLDVESRVMADRFCGHCGKQSVDLNIPVVEVKVTYETAEPRFLICHTIEAKEVE